MEKILIQEPDPSIREVIQLVLEPENFNVIALEKCDDQLLAHIKRIAPDLVILDFIMNGEESVDMLGRIRQRYPNLPVLAISCNSAIKNIYSRHGFDGYIEKPFNLSDLSKVIKRQLFICRMAEKGE